MFRKPKQDPLVTVVEELRSELVNVRAQAIDAFERVTELESELQEVRDIAETAAQDAETASDEAREAKDVTDDIDTSVLEDLRYFDPDELQGQVRDLEDRVDSLESEASDLQGRIEELESSA